MQNEKKILGVSVSEILVAIFLLIFIFSMIISKKDILAFKDYINSFGRLVPLILLIVIIIASSIGFIFPIPVAIASLLLGFYDAFLISILGLTIGAYVSFMTSRRFGREYIERKFVHRIKKLEHFDDNLRKNGLITVFFLRLVSLIPYELINVFAGFSEVSSPAFLCGTLLGIIPGTFLTVYLVQSTNDISSLHFILASLLMTLFSILPLLSKKVRKVIFG